MEHAKSSGVQRAGGDQAIEHFVKPRRAMLVDINPTVANPGSEVEHSAKTVLQLPLASNDPCRAPRK